MTGVKLHRRFAALALVALPVFVAACGGGTDDASTPATDPADAEATPAPGAPDAEGALDRLNCRNVLSGLDQNNALGAGLGILALAESGSTGNGLVAGPGAEDPELRAAASAIAATAEDPELPGDQIASMVEAAPRDTLQRLVGGCQRAVGR